MLFFLKNYFDSESWRKQFGWTGEKNIFRLDIPSVFTLFLLNILSLLQDFDRIVLDEAVLGVARMFREELVVMPHDEDYNRSNRYIKKSLILEGKIFSWDFLMTTVLFRLFVGIWENHFGLANFFYQFTPQAIQFYRSKIGSKCVDLILIRLVKCWNNFFSSKFCIWLYCENVKSEYIFFSCPAKFFYQSKSCNKDKWLYIHLEKWALFKKEI
jgi:hypothetical protein